MTQGIAGIWTRVSGANDGDYVALAGRYEEHLGYRPPHLETWVVRVGAERVETLNWGQRKWLTGIWRDSTGRIHVSDMDKCLHEREAHPDAASEGAWKVHQAAGNMMGLWGLDDACVFSWGLAEHSTPCVMRFDGGSWKRMDAPNFIVWDMHGCRRDRVFAVGDEGRVARWDGAVWHEESTPATGTLNSVFCASDDEAYVCGRDGELLLGTPDEWSKLLDAREGLHAVTKWRGDVWVGGALPLGLCQLQGDSLVRVAPLLAQDFDTRGDLLFSSGEHIVSSAEGNNFAGTPIDDFMAIVSGDPPSWR